MTNTTKDIYRQQPEEWIYDSSNYGKHVDRMTVESLHGKSDIAAELAWRDDQIEKLQQRNAELERERDGLNEFLKFVIGNSFEGCDTDGGSAQDKAVELGLLREEAYDKKVHGGDPQDYYELEEGDTLLVYANPKQYLAEHDNKIAAETLEKAVALYARKWDSEFESVDINIMKKDGFIYPSGLLEFARKIRNGKDGE